jgi:glutamine synthetase
MLGSSASVADPNIVLNTIVAEAFGEAAEKLEKASRTQEFSVAVKAYTEKLLKKHYRIIFNYNGYGPEWEEEAARRGLLNYKNTAEATEEWFKKENVDLFVRQGVYTKNEVLARAKIQLENYVKTVLVEARTAIDMAIGQIYPAVSAYVSRLCENLTMKKATFASIPTGSEEALIKDLATANEHMLATAHLLRARIADMPKDEHDAAMRAAHVIVPTLHELRKFADEAEKLCAADVWPFPNYYQLLYSVK